MLARLRGEGPLTANQLGGAKKGGPWWDWSEIKIAAEWLLDIGELVCRERRGFARVYDLAERAIPADLLAQDWSDEECAVRLVAAAGRSLGVATEADLAKYHGLPRPLVRRRAGLVRADGGVGGGMDAARLCRSRRAQRGGHPACGAGPCCCLRSTRSSGTGSACERLFDLRHRLEAYTPKEKRVYGYFAMPVLDGTRIVGLVDPGRRGEVLVAKQVTLLRPDAAGARGAGACGGGIVGRLHRVRGGAGGAGVGPGGGAGRGGVGIGRLSRRLRCASAARSAICSNVLTSPAVGPRLGRVMQHELVEAELGAGADQLVELVDAT